MVSAFRGVVDFFGEIGLFDVVLPFLLVFTVVFAILEKTKVFGIEEIEGKKYTRKNLNSNKLKTQKKKLKVLPHKLLFLM